MPDASTDAVSRQMSAQRRRDTACERALRSTLHRQGLRFFVHRRPLPGLRREADLVFPKVMVAVFVDGCFWHGCPQHGTWPKANADWWRAKIERNRERDADTDRRLQQSGWTAIRIWEHEDPLDAADRVKAAIATATDRAKSIRAS
jgi:DNA mismatch endonuclease, patch repair protein